MGSDAILTYKRRRPSSKTSAIDETSECVWQKTLNKFKHDMKRQRLSTGGTNLHGSTIPTHAEKSSGLEENSRSAKSNGTQTTFHESVIMKESLGERICHNDSAGKSDANVHSEAKSTDKIVKGQAHGNAGHADTSSASKEQSTIRCAVDPENEKDANPRNPLVRNEEENHFEEIDRSCCSSVPCPQAGMIRQVNELRSSERTEENSPFVALQPSQDSAKEKFSVQEKVCIDIQDNHHINQLDGRSQGSSIDDQNTTRMPGGLPGKRDTQASLDLSVSPHASRDIDLNMPLDCGSDEFHLPETSKSLHLSIDSTSKIKDNISATPLHRAENSSPVRALVDKGKAIVNYSPEPKSTSRKNKYLRLFPGSGRNNMLPLANDPQKVVAFTIPEERSRLKSLQPSQFHGVSLQPRQMINANASYSFPYTRPYVHIQPQEAIQGSLQPSSVRAPSLSSHVTMLENIINKAGTMGGHVSNSANKFKHQPTWSEDELDCLWKGVRRHGKGNWDAMFRDRTLYFMPWKTPRDLAERWEEEQFQLVYGISVSQLRIGSPYFSPQDMSNPQNQKAKGIVVNKSPSLGDTRPLYEFNSQKRSSLNYTNQKNQQLQIPVTFPPTISPYSYLQNYSWGEGNSKLGSERSSDAGAARGNLPHSFKQAVAMPPRPSDLAPPSVGCSGTSEQPRLNKSYGSMLGLLAEVEKRSRGPRTNGTLIIRRGNAEQLESRANKRAELDVVPNDASSEETISDNNGTGH